MAGGLLIGTSGWSYEGWRDHLYRGVARGNWLAHYGTIFNAVEVNATFYREQSQATLARWRDQTPPGFSFALKGHRHLTHNLKLHRPEEPFARQRENAAVLGSKLSAVLWQLPPRLGKNLALLEHFARLLATWPEVPQVFEPRHPSWFDEETASVLRAHGVAVCQSDAASWPMWDAVTSTLAYVRLHGHEDTYRSSYSDGQLSWWAGRIRQWREADLDVQVYFDNTDALAAPYDAVRLDHMLQQEPAGG